MKFLFFALAAALLISCDNGPREHNELESYGYAKDFVKEKLKSPRSARFPSNETVYNDGHVKKVDGNTFKISSWVDADNGFGASIRMNFSCTIIYKEGNATTNDLRISER